MVIMSNERRLNRVRNEMANCELCSIINDASKKNFAGALGTDGQVMDGARSEDRFHGFRIL